MKERLANNSYGDIMAEKCKDFYQEGKKRIKGRPEMEAYEIASRMCSQYFKNKDEAEKCKRCALDRAMGEIEKREKGQ